jgi:predicted deacylase
MSLSRRTLLGRAASAAAGAATLALPQLGGRALAQDGAALTTVQGAPQTPFEARGGAAWTSADEELAFLESLTGGPVGFAVEEIGRTETDERPLQLFAFGTDSRTGDVAGPGRPTVYVICSQHGNEPAGREAGIALIRDLAYADDPAVLELLSRATVLITPTANPDGRARNVRGNGQGVDINRDHLNLRTAEARAFAAVGNEWQPYMVVDHHEYGPGQPLLYDDDLLYLWPRNLNVDDAVRAGAKAYCLDYLKADAEAQGYTADEYGLAKVGPNVGPVQLPAGMPTGVQTAGDWDDGIARNAAGLRNTMGILVESAVSARAYDPADALNTMLRRVESQRVVMRSTLRHLAEVGEASQTVTREARSRQIAAGADQAAVYFDGQDEPHPSQNPASLGTRTFDDPGARQYRFDAALLDKAEGTGTLAGVLGLHELAYAIEDGEVVVGLDQANRGTVPLLLDDRGARSTIAGTPVYG